MHSTRDVALMLCRFEQQLISMATITCKMLLLNHKHWMESNVFYWLTKSGNCY